MVSRQSLDEFCTQRGFARYLETSAKQGTGCVQLREAIVRHIDWKEIPWESSPEIFKRLKEEIITLRDEGKILLRMGELKQHLELRLPGESFSPEQLRAVVGLLAGPGVVWKLEFGDFVLLQPERINAYAAAVIRKVRAHTEEIGCIPEEDVLAGKLDYQDMKRLPPEEEPIVLRAMHQTLVDHGLCLSEHTSKARCSSSRATSSASVPTSRRIPSCWSPTGSAVRSTRSTPRWSSGSTTRRISKRTGSGGSRPTSRRFPASGSD